MDPPSATPRNPPPDPAPDAGADAGRDAIHALLVAPAVDRAVAVLLALFGFRILWNTIAARFGAPGEGRGASPTAGAELAVVVAQALTHNLLLLARSAPSRVTLNPFHWILCVAGAHWWFLYGFLEPGSGTRLLPPEATFALTSAGAGLFVWARLSLGRSFGIVPAERAIVDRGPYRFVRHPIYAASFVGALGHHLADFSVASGAVWISGLGVMIAKALVEERFLRDSSAYREYAERVRCRFVPIRGL